MHGYYEVDSIADRVVLLFVFIPILRHELYAFVEDHNEHRIRRDNKRPNHVAGRPNDLYAQRPSGTEFGFIPDPALLERLREKVVTWGKLDKPDESVASANICLDMDAYLTEDTLAWCQQAIGAHVPLASEFLPTKDRTYLIPEWYRRLLRKARDHQRSGEAPALAFAPKPRKKEGWVPRTQVAESISATIATHASEGEESSYSSSSDPSA